jgi:hypothetical protein
MAFTTDATRRAHRYLVAYRSLRLDKQSATVTPAPKVPVTQVPRGSVIIHRSPFPLEEVETSVFTFRSLLAAIFRRSGSDQPKNNSFTRL